MMKDALRGQGPAVSSVLSLTLKSYCGSEFQLVDDKRKLKAKLPVEESVAPLYV